MSNQNGSCLQAIGRGPEAAKNTMPPPVGWSRFWYAAVKTPSDCCLALLLLILTAPLLILAGLAVRLSSRGPVIYSQTRLGRNGHPYTIYKIRTMYHNCEEQSGVCWSTKGDPRITPVGRFLRSTHIDELPQLWNILRGEMSLVGPRPERPEFVLGLEKALCHYRKRLGARPGITGLAQVQLPPDTDMDSVRRKLAHDLYYVENLSLWMDMRILACTALSALGLPFRISRVLFALPGGKSVELAYSDNDKGEIEEIPDGRPIVANAGTPNPATAPQSSDLMPVDA
jgi:lipopolysaccharide/colanic/teichoic acid biosynthesis glycosyltransferase